LDRPAQRIYQATPGNHGVDHVAWSPDGTTLTFVEQVTVGQKTCNNEGVMVPCPDLAPSVGVTAVADGSTRLLPIGSNDTPIGLLPDGHAYLLDAFDYDQGLQLLRALNVLDGSISTVLQEKPGAIFREGHFSETGKYFLYQSSRDSGDPSETCW